jgi:kinetochore protein NDC80
MNRSIRGLIAYLGSHGYDHPISAKVLTAPSVKDFKNLLEFLVGRIDPHFAFRGKLEDEVPGLMRRLGYPFTLSKSALKSVGSPHAWPTLLAALSWLVELLTYQEAVEVAEEAEMEVGGAAPADGFFDPSGGAGGAGSAVMQGAAGERVFFEYVSRAYVEFLEGRDDFDELDAGLIETFESRNRAVEAECVDTEARCASLKREIDALRGSKTPLQIVTEANADLAGDIDKFKKLIANREAHKIALDKKLAENEEIAAARASELAAARAEKEDLQATFDAQDYSAEDVARMNKDRILLEETVGTLETQRKEAEAVVWALEADISKKVEELDRLVHRFNTEASMLQLAPSSAKHAGGTDCTLHLNHAAKSCSEMVSVDLRGAVKPQIERLTARYTAKLQAARSALVAAETRASAANERLRERRSDLAGHEAAVERAEKELEALRASHDQILEGIADSASSLEKEMGETKDASAAAVAEAQRALQAANAEYEQARAEFAAEREKLSDCILNTLDVLTTHKTYIQESLVTACQVTTDLAGEIAAL